MSETQIVVVGSARGVTGSGKSGRNTEKAVAAIVKKSARVAAAAVDAMPVAAPAKLAKQATLPTGVTTKFFLLTPVMAQKFLDDNTHNRRLRQKSLLRYTADMKAGRWQATHQGISIAIDGEVIDGQHRLHAIVRSGVTVPMLVTQGLPLTTQAVVDNVIVRTVVDAISVSDRDGAASVTSMHAATGIRMFFGLSTTGSAPYRSRIEEIAFIRAHWEAIEFAVGLFPINTRLRGITVAAVTAAFGRAFYHESHTALRRAAEVLQSGINKGQNEVGLIQLRELLRARVGQNRKSNNPNTPNELYGKVCRVLNAYLKNEPISRNIVPVSKEIWLLPTVVGRPRSN